MKQSGDVYNRPYCPQFSIITVCLNAGNKLIETIGSVLGQDFTDFELIIKDGYSSDGSFERIPNHRNIFKIQERDSGIYDAMNFALKHAKGKYVLFLNAGDYFFDNKVLTSFYSCIIHGHSPSLVYCDYKTTALGVYVESPEKLSSFFLFRTMLCHQVCMIRRSCFERLGYFDATMKIYADYEFLLRLFFADDFTYLHIKKLGIVSTSYGFSFQNQQRYKGELVTVRRKYFPKAYFRYKLTLLLTLPYLRNKIAINTGLLSRLYQRAVNAFNRHFNN